MPDKAENSTPTYSWVIPRNLTIHMSFKVVTMLCFLVILILWGIDGWSFGSFEIDLQLLKFKTNQTRTQESPTEPQKILSSLPQSPLDFTNYNDQYHPRFSPRDSVNQPNPPAPPPPPPPLAWMSADLGANYTSILLARLLAPGDGEPCRVSRTAEISIPSMDVPDPIVLPTGHVHEFVFQALDDLGNSLCYGGDFFETDLSGDRWKSRPPVKDFGNGTYSFSLQVHPDFTGEYNLTVILLFRHFEGLELLSTQRLVFDKELRKIPIKFYKSPAQLPELATCKKSDFDREVWSGRWTRHGKNDSCSIDDDGRYRCLKPSFPCQLPWCDGHLGSLESNGWVYSSHCSFRIFSAETAWNCLNGRWIFFWGDSNHVDTIRNILEFILDVHYVKFIPRSADLNITNPKNPSEKLRITSIFNGHPTIYGNYRGLSSLEDNWYREFVKKYFSLAVVPDAVIMNSGLHDGGFWRNLSSFAEGAERAAAFWAEVMESLRWRGMEVPDVIYRTTVAAGGYAKKKPFNPHKMEVYNGVFVEKLRWFRVANLVVDDFDMTFPWHYDNRCNDGVHYGHPPSKTRWKDGKIGHQYFVDLMLCHVLVNAMCAG